MSQHDHVIDNGSGAAVRADINLMALAIASWNSGASAPSTMYARMRWVDTTLGVVKRRNAANSAWILDGTDAEVGVVQRASNTILASTDTTKTFVATAAFTQTLTAAATLGDRWWCAYNAAGYSIVFDPNGSETIDGATTKTVTGSGFIFCDGSAFYTVGFGPQATLTGLLQNVGLSVTMAANAVTIALKTAAGADASAANPVMIGFRSATIDSGVSVVRTVAAALSTVISSGSTGGTESAYASRIWIGAIDNAGTVELAWYQSRSGRGIAPINENGLISTTAEGGAGAADSAQTWYSTTARSNVAVTVLGYFESTQTTAGTWAASASAVVVNPRRRPGDAVQIAEDITGSVATGTTIIAGDDTQKTSSDGDQYMSKAITPNAAANLLSIDAGLILAHTVAGALHVILLQDATANALAGSFGGMSATGQPSLVPLHFSLLANTTSSTTFKLRAGSGSAGTMTFNGSGGSGLDNGKLASFLKITEVMV